MKPRLSEWQPLDLIDKEAVTPLRSFNSRSAVRDHRYYTLDSDNNAVCVADSDDEQDNQSESSEVEFICTHPIEDEATKTNKRRWRKFLLIIAVPLLLITCLVVVIVIQHVHSEIIKNNQACVTQSCVTGAAYILNKMDVTVDPCDNFYQFSCGNWVKNTPIPPSKSKYGSFNKIAEEIEVIMKEIMNKGADSYKGVNSTAVHKATKYYNMCLDEDQVEKDGIEPALKLIKELGSWPLTSDEISGTFNPNNWNVQDAIMLSHQRGFSPLFDLDVEVDAKNNSQYLIGIQQSGLTLGDAREYFKNNSKYDALKDAFMEFAKDFVKLLGAKEDIDVQINDIYKFEQKLALIQTPRSELYDPILSYNKMTLQEFQQNYIGDWFNMVQYVEGLFREIRTIPKNATIIVSTPGYFTQLGKIINETDTKTLANYMVWKSVSGMGGYLPDSFSDALLILDKAESGIKEYGVRWKRCLSRTTSILGYALGALYVEDNFNEDNKREVESLFEGIREAFIANLDQVNWMDDSTRDYAKVKASAITKMLGYPDFVADPALLDQHYENLTLIEGEFFQSKLLTMRFQKEKNLRLLGTIPDHTEWSMVPTEVNAYYSSDFNQIVFPAGILRPPLFNMDKPKFSQVVCCRSFNFGSFGMICGHELTHGFDNKGRNFDKSGNMNNWWSNSSMKSFKKKSQCFIDFYSNYTEDNTHLDGKLTLSENIADNGGMKMAYLAYERWLSSNKGDDSFRLPGVQYNSDQLFFIGMAQLWCSHYTPAYIQKSILTDVHSIAKYRVLAAMSNSQKFAEAYSCPVNSPMNPDQKCSVW